MKSITQLGNKIYDSIDTSKYFTEREAWNCFRLAAFGEAIGWTILISGISIKYFFVPYNNDPVLVAGQIHGTLFLIYFVAVFVFFSSLRLTRRQTLIAVLASIPPYGTLIFEKWLAYQRRQKELKSFRKISVRAVITVNYQLLVVQPKENSFWCLPGGVVKDNEKIEQALTRIIKAQFNKTPKISSPIFIYEHKDHGNDQLEFFFEILNSSDYSDLDKTTKTNTDYDEIAYIKSLDSVDLQPSFLTQTNILSQGKQASFDKFIYTE